MNKIILGSVGGGVSLLFLCLKLYLQDRAAKNLKVAMDGSQTGIEKEQDDYYKNNIRPITEETFKRIKIVGVMGDLSKEDSAAYVGAVGSVASKLHALGVKTELASMTPVERLGFINEVAKQMQLALVPKVSFFSKESARRLLMPHVTPHQIEEKSMEIANTIASLYRAQIETPPLGGNVPSFRLFSQASRLKKDQPFSAILEESSSSFAEEEVDKSTLLSSMA